MSGSPHLVHLLSSSWLASDHEQTLQKREACQWVSQFGRTYRHARAQRNGSGTKWRIVSTISPLTQTDCMLYLGQKLRKWSILGHKLVDFHKPFTWKEIKPLRIRRGLNQHRQKRNKALWTLECKVLHNVCVCVCVISGKLKRMSKVLFYSLRLQIIGVHRFPLFFLQRKVGRPYFTATTKITLRISLPNQLAGE